MVFVLMMESTYKDLATRTLSLLEKSGSYRIIIILIGAPGSGKSTIAQRVVDILNEKHVNEGKHMNDILIHGGDVLHANDTLPDYDSTQIVDIEDERYTPTKQRINDCLIIRGRGGDDTALRIRPKADDENKFAQVIPMDGFHLPRSVLHRFEDSDNAILRRGSAFTFDSSLVVRLVKTLKDTLDVPCDIPALNTAQNEIPDIDIPSFSHSEHDPKQYGTRIHGSARVLVMEGLYLLLDNPVWREIALSLEPGVSREDLSPEVLHVEENHVGEVPVPSGKNHEFWKILIDDDKMLERVGKRHLKAGIVNTLAEGEERVKVNDLPNGKKVYRESFKSDINIISIDDANEA